MSTTLELVKTYYERKLCREVEVSELLIELEKDIERALRCALKDDQFNNEEIKIFKANYLFYNKIYDNIKKELEV